MGEIAEMMLDGTLCEGCGEYIGSEAGYPQYCCDDCRPNDLPRVDPDIAEGSGQFFVCGICNKRLKTAEGVKQHKRAKHEDDEKDKT